MSVTGEVDWEALAAPFEADQIEWRLQQAGEKNGRIWGMALAYVTNRAIMQRLDEVVGPGNWKNEFARTPDGEGVLCGLAIRVPREGGTFEWVMKWDGADSTDIEATKGGLSGAMKRAAVQFGIGRYLYKLEEGWIEAHEQGQYRGKTKDGTWFRWNPPQLPGWALPDSPRQTGSARAAADAAQEIDPEIAPLITLIRQSGAEAPDAAEFNYRRKTHNLKDFIRQQWSEIKTDKKLAEKVLTEIQKHVEVPA